MLLKCIEKNIRKIVYTKVYMSVFFKKEEVGQAIGLDIGTSSVKVVQLRKEKDKIVLDTYGEVALGPYNALKNWPGCSLRRRKTTRSYQRPF